MRQATMGLKNIDSGVPLWCSRLRIQRCHTVAQVTAVVKVGPLPWECPHATGTA